MLNEYTYSIKLYDCYDKISAVMDKESLPSNEWADLVGSQNINPSLDTTKVMPPNQFLQTGLIKLGGSNGLEGGKTYFQKFTDVQDPDLISKIVGEFRRFSTEGMPQPIIGLSRNVPSLFPIFEEMMIEGLLEREEERLFCLLRLNSNN